MMRIKAAAVLLSFAVPFQSFALAQAGSTATPAGLSPAKPGIAAEGIPDSPGVVQTRLALTESFPDRQKPLESFPAKSAPVATSASAGFAMSDPSDVEPALGISKSQEPAQSVPAKPTDVPDMPPMAGDPAAPEVHKSTSGPAIIHEPVGTAVAEPLQTTGVAASKPAGAAVAPAEQHRVRTILIRVGSLVGAGVAIGTTMALSQGSPSRPPGSH